MVLYNVTVGIDREIAGEWLNWMRQKHIPDIMNSGMFLSYKIFKVLGQDEEPSISYSIQYFSESVDNVVRYLHEYAPPLVEEHMTRYKDKHVAFRTLLEEVYPLPNN